jgi:hypothetical protein
MPYAGDDQAAKQDFARAEAMDPGSAEGYNARVWLLSPAPDPRIRDGKKGRRVRHPGLRNDRLERS